MDVGSPSNFVRILELFHNDIDRLDETLSAASIDDRLTAETMLEIYQETGYILDPHGAVGYRCLADYIEKQPEDCGLFLETAHPVKFDSVSEIIGRKVDVPPSLAYLASREKQSIEVQNKYTEVKEILLNRL
mgnify:FL=1